MHGLPGAFSGLRSLSDLLSLRAAQGADDLLYRFLADDGAEVAWTYGALERASSRIAAALQELSVEGERILLLYPTDLEYVAAFFACLAVGAIAVPAYPPRPGRASQRLDTIRVDSGARIALVTAAVRDSLDLKSDRSAWLRELSIIATDELPETSGAVDRPRTAGPDTVAFLQYTSGSTGDPKGVVVTHGNLLHNLAAIYNAFDIGGPTSTVSWLPIYHDMGLIGGALEPLYAGGSLTLLSPKRFQENPLAWLQAISKYKATHAGGPTFAYEWCLRRTSPAERAALDLSHWRVAFCGAEPIRRETLHQFSEAFAPAGFRGDIFWPCYGLAEATLMVTSRSGGDELISRRVPKRALEQGQFVPDEEASSDGTWMVGSGAIVGRGRVEIVDPETCRRCSAGQIGEIWIQSPSVTRGYWNREQLSAETFGARLADSGEGPFLRTGDLGVFHDRQLFVTGRIKDLIIVRGRNHYPQDIEITAEASHAALQPAGGAAFGIASDGPEQIVLVHEVRRDTVRGLDAAAVIRAICQATAREHEVALDAVGLVRPGSLARTTSGKIERHTARRVFESGQFDFIQLWRSPVGGGAVVESENGPRLIDENPAAPLDWLCTWLARRLELDRSQIDPHQPLAVYGLDSLMAVELLGEVEQKFGHRVDVGALLDAPSLASLAQRFTVGPGGVSAQPTELAVVPPAGVVRPTYIGPFGDRPDGILVRDESPMREIMPYLMRSRVESVVYYDAQYDAKPALTWLEAYNRRHREQRATLSDLFLWAAALIAHVRPGLNRFVSGRRIYQRREVTISFAAKKQFDMAAELATVKLAFPERAPAFPATVERIARAVDEARHGPPRAVDRETRFFMRLPRFLFRLGFSGYRVLDHCNLLPGKVFANDPLYATLFVTNLGSLGLDGAMHHLYEHGNCSLFAALGVPKHVLVATPEGRAETRHVWPVRWTFDERIVDGFYAAAGLRLLKSVLENPDQFIPLEADRTTSR